MSTFTRFFVSTPSRHPANQKAYDPGLHRYKPEYVNPDSWILNLAIIPPGFSGSLADWNRMSSFSALANVFGLLDKAEIPDELISFEWTVRQPGGTFSKTVSQPRSPSMWRERVEVPGPGEYEVTLQANLKGGRREVNAQRYRLRDFLVVSIGDSYAAGQGNPDVVAVPGPDQTAMCKATTLKMVIDKVGERLKEFADDLLEKTKETVDDYLPFVGKIIVAQINFAEDSVGFIKRAADSVASAFIDFPRDVVENALREGAEEVLSWFGLGDGGETDDILPRPAGWQEPYAYRSYRSGHSLAARQVETDAADGADRITFISLARSGAEIDHGLLGPRTFSGNQSMDGWAKHRGQVQEAQDTVLSRPIDALIVTIGGNDLGFSSQVQDAILQTSGEKRNARIAEALRRLESDLPKQFSLLKQAIDERLKPRKVFILEYPVGVFKEVAEQGPCGVLGSLFGLNMDKADAQALGDLGRRLNAKIRAIADEFGWILIDGIETGFDGHGYCAGKSYFVSAEESCLNQGDFEGMVHPNKLGHEVIRDRIALELRKELLVPNGNWLDPVLSVMMRPEERVIWLEPALNIMMG